MEESFFENPIMNFDDILRQSLAAVNDGYMSALNDLSGTVDKVREAVIQNADDKVGLELQKVASDLKSSTFRFFLDPNVADINQELITITCFQIPSSGYPIKCGTLHKPGNHFTATGEIEDREGLLRYFSDLLQQPESRLVQAIGFALRQRSN
jgi:hypothetical protein